MVHMILSIDGHVIEYWRLASVSEAEMLPEIQEIFYNELFFRASNSLRFAQMWYDFQSFHHQYLPSVEHVTY